MTTYPVRFLLNGNPIEVDVAAQDTLLETLRNKLWATEVKNGCGKGDCGCCAVLLDGRAVNSCLTLAVQANGKEVVTVKGLGNEDHPHPLQESFIRKGAIQCGFCTSGMIISAKSLLDEHPQPSPDQIREAVSGNLCRCTGYKKIIEAISDAAPKCSPSD
jgi:carbon-monoxide dehydrogenase small subunit